MFFVIFCSMPVYIFFGLDVLLQLIFSSTYLDLFTTYLNV